MVTHQLDALARLLERAGLQARVTQPIGRPPGLHVQNPALPALEEHIVLDRCAEGTWWLWWGWAERIAPADDLEHAAESIRRVVEPAYSTPISRG